MCMNPHALRIASRCLPATRRFGYLTQHHVHFPSRVNQFPRSINSFTPPSALNGIRTMSSFAGDNKIPDGWSDEEWDLDTDGFHNEAYKLGKGQVLLWNNKDSNYLVKADGRYFLWNDISDYVVRIEGPTEYDDILKALSDPYPYPDLKTTPMEPSFE